jgi:hypothetical protein
MLQARTAVITIVSETVGFWPILAAVFSAESRRLLVPVQAIIGNSVPTSARGTAILLNWKREVARAAKLARNGGCLDPRQSYSISAGFSFHRPSHGNQALDVENFLKPTFDGLAAGAVLRCGYGLLTLRGLPTTIPVSTTCSRTVYAMWPLQRTRVLESLSAFRTHDDNGRLTRK